MSWDSKFPEPIAVPVGKPLVTLREAGQYIAALPAETHSTEAWLSAMHVLIQAADHGGPIEFARLGMMQALQPNSEPLYRSASTEPKWRSRHKLVRDR
jgi:hypothetical protein